MSFAAALMLLWDVACLMWAILVWPFEQFAAWRELRRMTRLQRELERRAKG